MTIEQEPKPFGRVLVAFDASPQGHALLQLAADLARCFDSSLAGLFVEDESALSYADLPIAHEVTLGTAAVRSLNRERMLAHCRAQSRLARRALEGLAVEHRLTCSFVSRSGQAESAIAAMTIERDLVLTSSRVGLVPRAHRRGSLEGAARGAAAGLLALADPRRALAVGPVAVVVTGDEPELGPLLSVAGRIAQQRQIPIAVIALATGAQRKALDDRIRALLPADSSLRVYAAAGGDDVLGIIAGEQPCLLIVPDSLPDDTRRRLAESGHPALVVRSANP